MLDVMVTGVQACARPILVVGGGHDVVGALAPSSQFLFAEGTVRPGFVEYLTLQNPGGVAATATLAFQASNDSGGAVGVPHAVVSGPANSRLAGKVKEWVASRGPPTPPHGSVKLTFGPPPAGE